MENDTEKYLDFPWKEEEAGNELFYSSMDTDFSELKKAQAAFSRGTAEQAADLLIAYMQTRTNARWYYDLRNADAEEYRRVKFPRGVPDELFAEADDLLDNRFYLAQQKLDF